MEHSLTLNYYSFLLIFGERNHVSFSVCLEYIQVRSSMHGYVNGSLMSICACLFLSISLLMNFYEYFFECTVLEIQRCVI